MPPLAEAEALSVLTVVSMSSSAVAVPMPVVAESVSPEAVMSTAASASRSVMAPLVAVRLTEPAAPASMATTSMSPLADVRVKARSLVLVSVTSRLAVSSVSVKADRLLKFVSEYMFAPLDGSTVILSDDRLDELPLSIAKLPSASIVSEVTPVTSIASLPVVVPIVVGPVNDTEPVV